MVTTSLISNKKTFYSNKKDIEIYFWENFLYCHQILWLIMIFQDFLVKNLWKLCHRIGVASLEWLKLPLEFVADFYRKSLIIQQLLIQFSPVFREISEIFIISPRISIQTGSGKKVKASAMIYGHSKGTE